MTVTLDTFSDRTLPPARSEEDYRLYRAALEWRLTAPIVIRSAEDILSAATWSDRLEPYYHQVRNLMTFCRLAPAAIVADEVGLGKTISAGLILSELLARRRVARALVLCPKVLCDQWVAELDDKFRIEAQAVTGRDLLDAVRGGGGVIVTTYESAGLYLSAVPPDTFGMLILDEAHRLRNLHGAGEPPRSAAAVRVAVAARRFNYVLMLTATPVQNRFWDVYSLVDLLTLAKGHKNPFGTPKEFRNRYLHDREGRRLRHGTAEAFRRVLRGYVARTRRAEARLPFPTREVRLERVPLTQAERGLEALVGEIVGDLSPLAQSSLGQALMSSPAALAAQFETMSETHPRLALAAARARAAANAPEPPAKFSRLYHLCDELARARPDWRLVVFTRRRETQEMIRRGLEARGVPVGLIAGGRAAANRRDTLSFSADPPEVRVLVSTDAGAEGVNLQSANVLVNYDLPWNPMVLEQRIGRVQRLGSKHQSVIVLNLVAAETVEERVVERLMQKLTAVTETVGDMESVLAGVVEGGEDGRDERFESVVRDLVVRSLQGQDTRWAAQLQEQSIERAKREYVERRDQINHDLGQLDAIHSTGPTPPVFERPQPSMPADQFVLRAWAARSRAVREVLPGVYEENGCGRPQSRMALTSEAAEAAEASGLSPILFLPGQPAFERLAEDWAGRQAHRVFDLTPQTAQAAERIAREWLSRYEGATFVSASVRGKKPLVSGSALVLVTASNGVDQYQKLLDQPVAPEGHKPLPISQIESTPPLRATVSLGEVAPKAVEKVRRAVEADEALGRFYHYYAARRVDELSRAGDNPHLQRRVDVDFSVTSRAEVVGFRGARYDEALIDVRFLVEGEEYTATLQAVPATGQVIEQPTEDHCEVTGLRMPYGVLGKCDRTGRLFPLHRLYKSAFTGRQAEKGHIVRCELTGMPAIDDEVERSAVSGTVAYRGEFVTCGVSGDRVLSSEAGVSAVSGKTVRKDRLRPSDKPPHRLGTDAEFGICEVGGLNLLVDELGVSEASGKRVDRTLLVPSGLSGRPALKEELVVCQISGLHGLPDETGNCAITGLRVDKKLLATSQVSGAQALASHMVTCSVSGCSVLPGELERCGVTGKWVLPTLLETCCVSGTRAIATEMARCASSGLWLLKEYTAQSDVSGDWVDARLLTASDLPPHRRGLASELARCAATGRTLLSDEVGSSEVSGRIVGLDLLATSAASGRRAAPDEMVVCEESGAVLLPDEAARCEETGRTVDTRLLTELSPSGRKVLSRLTGVCARTGRRVLTRELERCGLTGALVLPTELETCAATGVRAVRERLGRCEVTGSWLLPDHLARSAVSGRVVDRRLLRPSDLPPGRLGLPEEFTAGEVTGRNLLRDEVVVSAVSKKVVGRDRVVRSAVTGRLALPDETVRCEETGVRLLPDEAGRCTETGRLVNRRCLVLAGSPPREVLARLTGVCSRTNTRVPLSELEICALTRAVARRSEFETCAVTGVRCLKSSLARSDVSGRYAVPDQCYRSPVSGKVFLPDEGVRCRWSGARVLRTEAGKCDFTGLVVTKGHLNADGQLKPLADLLDGRLHAVPGYIHLGLGGDRLLPFLQSLDPDLAGATGGWAVCSPDGRAMAAVLQFEVRGWFSRATEFVGIVVRTHGKSRVIGEGVRGRCDGMSGEFSSRQTLVFS
jgi:superfamily II DNA or RNA helicase